MRGKAECWYHDSDEDSYYKRTKDTHGKELYLNSVNYLFGSENEETKIFASGVHTFSFECQLPSEIPYSIEAKYASIRYKVVANLKFPNDKDYQFKKTFTVARYDDLGLLPFLELPYEAETINSFCSFLCIPSSIIMKVSLPRTGFTLGETIPVTIEIINESSQSVSHTAVSLKKRERFAGTLGDILDTKSTILKVRSSSVNGRKQNFSNVNIDVPQNLLTSNQMYCRIYQIIYELKIAVVLKGINKGPFVRIPIIIGKSRSENYDPPLAKLRYMSHPNFRRNM